MNDIDKAIEYLSDAVTETNEIISECSTALQAELIEQKRHFEVAISALQKQLQQESNEPLSLEELMVMENVPVWCDISNRWGIIGKKQVGENQYRSVIGFAYGWEWLEDVYACSKGGIYATTQKKSKR